MQNHPLNLFCSNYKITILKTILFFIISLFCLLNLSAQTEGIVKLKMETGILWTSKSANPGFPWFNGFFLQLEPNLKVSKNTFIGLRIGASINEKIESYDPIQFYRYDNPSDGLVQFTNPDNGIVSIIPTFDYYFNENNLRPYFGMGIGYYFLTNFTEVLESSIANPSENILEVSVKNRVGVLVRGGLDLGKFIVGLEYNFIPTSDIEIPNGQKIGTVNNSYIGLSVGYAIVVRKS